MDKLVLLCLADFADDDGASVYPSVRRVAVECGVGERHVQRVIARLIKTGEMVLVSQGGGRHRTSEYRIDLAALKRCSEAGEEVPSHSRGKHQKTPPRGRRLFRKPRPPDTQPVIYPPKTVRGYFGGS